MAWESGWDEEERDCLEGASYEARQRYYRKATSLPLAVYAAILLVCLAALSLGIWILNRWLAG